MTTYGVEKGWSVSGPSLSLHFGMEPKLVHRSTVAGIVNQPIVVSEGELGGGAIIYLSGGSLSMMWVDGCGLVEELYIRLKAEGVKYSLKVTSSLMMKKKDTIVVKVVYEDYDDRRRAVITTVAQKKTYMM